MYNCNNSSKKTAEAEKKRSSSEEVMGPTKKRNNTSGKKKCSYIAFVCKQTKVAFGLTYFDKIKKNYFYRNYLFYFLIKSFKKINF